MIDTDKYEGHTDGSGWIWEAFWDKELVKFGKTDRQLIADAPLLLAEVERLRGIAKACLEAIETGGDPRSGTIELIEHNLKLMEMIE